MTTIVPPRLTAGDSWAWSYSSGDHPAPDWVATTYIENRGAAFNVVGVPDGTDHLFAVAASVSATYTPGAYRWHVRVAHALSGVVATVASGDLAIAVDPAAAGLTDTRTWAARTLEAIEAFLAGNATTAQQGMSIQGRSITRWPLDQLLEWRDKLRQEVAQEESAATAGLGRNFKVRYVRP